MRLQPNRNYKSNDRVMTPYPLAELILDHFRPKGSTLEPCRGSGSFYDQMNEPKSWCEIEEGRDFLTAWHARVDWIVTNPPWSKFTAFLEKAVSCADEVVFLVTINHWWTKRRIRIVREAGFGYREILIVDWPKAFPSSGFGLGAMWISKRWQGPMKISHLEQSLEGQE